MQNCFPRLAIGVLLPLFLSACSLLSFQETKPNIDNTQEKQLSHNQNSEYYFNIAQELYEAKQYEQAYKIVLKLAENNDPQAKYLLGYLTYYGQGTAENKALGTQLIQSSADAGYRPAIEGLVMIKHGLTPENKCEPVFIEIEKKVPAQTPEIN
jgi:outer membrane PBP1 activator LpoA protein